MKLKTLLGRLLLAFVLVSIGFAFGKHSGTQKSATAEASLSPATAGGDKVVVYYLHASFRCETCNLVESMGEELVRTEFSRAFEAGALEWRPVDFQNNDALAQRYNVAGNMIVVARFRGGQEIEHRRLDRVMELAHNPGAFAEYLRSPIEALLGERP